MRGKVLRFFAKRLTGETNPGNKLIDYIPKGIEMHSLELPYKKEDTTVQLVAMEKSNSIHGNYLNGNFFL